MADDVWARTAARFRKPVPRWASPAALAAAVDPSWRSTPALAKVDEALVDVAEGRCKRLMVFLSPQEGKTSLVAQVFPLWLLTFRPDGRAAIASYGQEIADRNGRRIRDLIAAHDGAEGTLDLGLRVKRGDHAAGRWSLEGHDGGVVCVGIGGSLTGRPVTSVLIIDDPTKDHEEAMSSAHRARVWEWWRTVARTRLSPDAAVVLVMTRWHAKDLAGKLLEDAAEPWRVVSIPAIADSPDDPLGREMGEPMVSARGERDWDSIRRAVGEYTWASLYQQRPAPLAGGIFNRDKVRFWRPMAGGYEGREQIDLDGRRAMLEDCWTFLVADLAASVRTSADFTVIGTFAITLDGDLVLLDLRRDRMAASGHLEAARPMFRRWGAHTLYIESTFQSSTLVYEATREGIPVSELKADTDKVTRALPAAARVDQGRVWVPFGAPWVTDFLDEIAAFPNGAHDDQCDVLSYSARVAAAYHVPPQPAEMDQLSRKAGLPNEFERAVWAGYDSSALDRLLTGEDW